MDEESNEKSDCNNSTINNKTELYTPFSYYTMINLERNHLDHDKENEDNLSLGTSCFSDLDNDNDAECEDEEENDDDNDDDDDNHNNLTDHLNDNILSRFNESNKIIKIDRSINNNQPNINYFQIIPNILCERLNKTHNYKLNKYEYSLDSSIEPTLNLKNKLPKYKNINTPSSSRKIKSSSSSTSSKEKYKNSTPKKNYSKYSLSKSSFGSNKKNDENSNSNLENLNQQTEFNSLFDDNIKHIEFKNDYNKLQQFVVFLNKLILFKNSLVFKTNKNQIEYFELFKQFEIASKCLIDWLIENNNEIDSNEIQFNTSVNRCENNLSNNDIGQDNQTLISNQNNKIHSINNINECNSESFSCISPSSICSTVNTSPFNTSKISYNINEKNKEISVFDNDPRLNDYQMKYSNLGKLIRNPISNKTENIRNNLSKTEINDFSIEIINSIKDVTLSEAEQECDEELLYDMNNKNLSDNQLIQMKSLKIKCNKYKRTIKLLTNEVEKLRKQIDVKLINKDCKIMARSEYEALKLQLNTFREDYRLEHNEKIHLRAYYEEKLRVLESTNADLSFKLNKLSSKSMAGYESFEATFANTFG